jgi:hypothetical protein
MDAERPMHWLASDVIGLNRSARSSFHRNVTLLSPS